MSALRAIFLILRYRGHDIRNRWVSTGTGSFGELGSADLGSNYVDVVPWREAVFAALEPESSELRRSHHFEHSEPGRDE